jgi:acetoacetyl-CoA reductase
VTGAAGAMFDLSGQTALVTGASGGIGGAIARALHRQGAAVAVAGTRGAVLARLVGELGERAHALTGDLAEPDSPDRLVREAEAAMGRVDILINNAGITRDAVLHKMSPEHWNEVIATNLGSCFNMCRLVIDGMRERRFGRIVNIGSINGQAGQYGQVNYAAAKSGIHGFTKALAQEGAGRGVTVNAIAPGYIDTDMVRAVPPNVLEKIVARIPVGRLGQADEIARGVLFLVSDEGGFVTGSTLSINGGQHMY